MRKTNVCKENEALSSVSKFICKYEDDNRRNRQNYQDYNTDLSSHV